MHKIEIISSYNTVLSLNINHTDVILRKRGYLFNSVSISDNHCGCGLGNIEEKHRGFPNNFNDFDFGKVISAIDFIWWYDWRKITTKNTKHSSYGLKHLIERSTEYQNACKHNNVKTYDHLGNGELILAMMLLKFKTFSEHWESQNVYFNVSEKSLLFGPQVQL